MNEIKYVPFTRKTLNYARNFKGYKLAKLETKIRSCQIEKRKVPSIKIESLHLARKLVKKFPIINKLVISKETIEGLASLRRLSAGTKFAVYLNNDLVRDDNKANFLINDLEILSEIGPKEEKEIDRRLAIFDFKVRKVSTTKSFADQEIAKQQVIPETYAKIARSIEFRKIGSKPNHVTEHLKKRGYTDADLKDFMSLSAMSAVCLTDKEYKRIQQYRRDCPFPDMAYKILTTNDYANYVNGNYTSIIGFWVDAAHYEGVTTEKMIYDLLRLDYPNSEFNANAEKIYVMRFSPEVALEQAQIPFMNRIKIINNKGELFNNVPGNPLTGNGNVATRENVLIPEYKATTRHSIPFIEEQTCIGYFDKTGKFHEEYMFYMDKWVDMKQYETHKEIEKLIDVLEHRSADLVAKDQAKQSSALDR